MRLLELQFENVNSLYGHWRVDFTDPQFQQNPLFAIIGPTGSGKSSLLDAISLALYGQTPRMNDLPRVSEDDYDRQCPVMSKGETQVWASVRFQVDGVTYSSYWRRRWRRGGNSLAPVEVELVRYPDANAQEGELLTNKKSQWDEMIREITRMTFQTFLRSVMLSQGAFADFLKARDDERANILEQITGTDIYTNIGRWISQRAKKETLELESLRSQLNGIELLSQENRQALEQEKETLAAKTAALRSTQKSLSAARTWRENLNNAQKNVERCRQRLDELEERRRLLARDLEAARRAREAALAAAALEAYEERKGTLDKVSGTLSRTLAGLPLAEEALAKANAGIAAAREALEKARQEAAHFEPVYLKVMSLDREIDSQRQIGEQNRSVLDGLLTRTAKDSVSREALEGAIKTLGERIGSLEKALSQLTPGSREEKPSVIKEALEGWENAIHEVEKEKAALGNARTQLDGVLGRRAALERALLEAGERYSRATAAVEAQRNALEVLQNAVNLKAKLSAFGELTAEAVRTENFSAVRLALDELEHSLADIDPQGVPVWWQRTGKPALMQGMAHIRTRLGLDTLESDTVIEQRLEEIERLKAELLGEGDEEGRLREALKNALAEEKTARSALEAAQTAHSTHETELSAVKTALEKTGAVLAVRESTLTQYAQKTLSMLNLSGDTDIVAARERLATYSREWDIQTSAGQQLQTAQTAVREKTAALGTLDAQMQETARQLERQQELVRENQEALKTLAGERKALFGDRDPAEARRVLEEALEKKTRTLAGLEADCLKIQTRKTALEAERGALLRQQTEAQTALEKADRHLQACLKEQQLDSVEALRAVMLPAQTIASRLQAGDNLKAQTDQATGALQAATGTLEELQKSPRSELTLEEIDRALEKLEEESDALSKRQSALLRELDLDDHARAQSSRLLEQIRLQTDLTGQWQSLNQLIGSADGKKFRGIAQKITFRILLREANAVMKTMTRRFTLHASGASGMGVDVVDHDMGSVIRTAANLSGGETFMVSLALALALSRMGGRYLSVDTLFLDEGFGTLDEAALNKAIYALETLQRRSGKMIGLISHVKMIRERLALQLEVRPVPGTGRSILIGPGISRL